MNKVKEILESLKKDKKVNSLYEYVLNYYINESSEYDLPEDFLKDMERLYQIGCVSGSVPSLIYYEDTDQFYNQFQDEINDLVNQFQLSPAQLLGDKFDDTDPDILESENKQQLSWFAFETMALRIYNELNKKLSHNYEV